MDSECRLITGGYATVIQVLLVGAAVGALLYKRNLETPRRHNTVWGFDVAKQLTSGAIVHVSNIVFSAAFATSVAAAEHDECAWYFINYTLDVTLGVVIIWRLQRFVEDQAKVHHFDAVAHSGNYGDPPDVHIWVVQMLAWNLVVIAAKICTFGVVLLFPRVLGQAGRWLVKPVHPYPRVELGVVMVIGPCLMNMANFWIFDNLLKRHDRFNLEGTALTTDEPLKFELEEVSGDDSAGGSHEELDGLSPRPREQE